MNPWQELGTTALAWLALAVPVTALCLGLWWTLPARRPLWPRQTPGEVPWTGWELLSIAVLVLICPGLVLGLVQKALGPPAAQERLILATSTVGLLGSPLGQGPLLSVSAGHPERLPLVYQQRLQESLASLLAFPLEVAGILLFLWSVRQVRPEQLGLHLVRGRQAVLLGGLAWLVGSPIIFGVNVLTSWLYLQWTGERPLEHGLLQLMQGRQPYLEWTLLLGSALVMAPFMEELLFRGLLLRWAGVRSGHASVLFLSAFLLGGLRLDALDSDSSLSQWLPALFRVEKCLFLLCLLPGYLLLPLLLRRRVPAAPPTPEEKYTDSALLGDVPHMHDSCPAPVASEADSSLSQARAIYATAVLFAVIHVWPTPIPLFLLGLLLGWLAARTQSLLAPVTLHFLFNAVACLLVLGHK